MKTTKIDRQPNESSPIARKRSIYIRQEMLDEIMAEASRLDRSASWLMARAWQIARRAIKDFPTQT